MLRALLPLVVAFVLSSMGATGITYVRAAKATAARVSEAKQPTPKAHPAVVPAGSQSSSLPTDATVAVAPASAPDTGTAAAAGRVSPQRTVASPTVSTDGMHRAAASTPKPARSAAPDTAKGPAFVPERTRTTTPSPGTPSAKPAANVASAAGPAVSPVPISEGRLSKIFTSMPARDAAKVLEQLSEADVVTILKSVSDRKAAELLSLLPTTRAVSISKAVLDKRLEDK